MINRDSIPFQVLLSMYVLVQQSFPQDLMNTRIFAIRDPEIWNKRQEVATRAAAFGVDWLFFAGDDGCYQKIIQEMLKPGEVMTGEEAIWKGEGDS